MARLIAYLVGVGAMGVIAQAAVGSALHDAVWTTQERAKRGGTRIVTATTPGLTSTLTVTGETVTRPRPPSGTVTAPGTTGFVTVAGPTRTTTVSGPELTTTVSETVPVPGPTLTSTVNGPTVT